MLRVLLAAALVLAALPIAHAATPSCAAVTSHAHTPAGPYVEQPPQTVLVRAWAETNLLAGLQKVACVAPDGATVEPDRYLGEFGVAPGGQPVCVPRVGCVFV